MVTEVSEDQPLLSHRRRLAGMLFEPRRVMGDLARRPRWLLPVVLFSVPTAAMITGTRLGVFLWMHLDSLEPSRGELVGAVLYSLAAAVGVFVEEAALLLLTAPALSGLIHLLGFSLSIRHSRAIVSYSLVPLILIGIPVAVFEVATIVLSRSESSIPGWIWLNAASILDWSAPHPLAYSFARQIGVFSVWRWLLVALGLTVVVRSISFRVALGAAAIVLVSVKSIWNAAWLAVIDPDHLHWP